MQNLSSLRNPQVDFHNPFYCPAIPAATYIKTLRQTTRNKQGSHQTTDANANNLFNAYARMMERSEQGEDSDVDFAYDSENDWIVGRNLRPQAGKKRRLAVSPPAPVFFKHFRVSGVNGSNTTAATNTFDLSGHPLDMQSTLQGISATLKRKRDFSDLLGTPKHAKSDSFGQDESFEVEVKRTRLNFSVESSPVALPESPAAPAEEATTSSCLDTLRKVEELLPGLRLRDRFRDILGGLDTQHLADILAEDGLITPAILDILRTTSIYSLSLAASLAEEGGLNICGQDMLKILNKPGSFESLTELSLAGSRINDFDLIHIHRLPKLSALHLNQTSVGNEAVFLLVPLKRTLTRLSLTGNPAIDDDCVPALLLLTQLSFLSVLDTSIDMAGLRKLAAAANDGHYESIDIEIPTACEAYIDNLDDMYFLNPRPPLITDPELCTSLTAAALRKNLSAHAAKNRDIVTTGSQTEMAARLAEILRRRQGDLIVARMLRG
ncbi:hypothetical protein CC1G_06209 [Coprinopsis cinerea okayama7|uniref:Uncharacterized protein n=1 Tax=Coprinopsis cinerea (strain Okayama-7 / 130 / ATCC MYA-4618 / FGSC 9003) TaxID=240176 RepID=A8NV83_COPC7|nr:hypothetical protein CC1G_06209 [Coprinopsis cinerea okayama7\|eukprot:XP_001836622.1 hypothetical protein CC1G_06209 [Coprinopsis cinerea okayama7\